MDNKVVSINSKKSTATSGGGGNMEARIARLESDVEHIKREITEIKADTRELKNNTTTTSVNIASIQELLKNKSDKADIEKLRGELHQLISKQTKWIVGTLIGIAGSALLIAVVKMIFKS